MRRLFIVVLVAVAASSAFAKSLHWRDLAVAARLDADGVLHVVERQTIVFDGDWNGSERTFRLRGGQSLRLESLSRVDRGVEKPLTEGDLDRADHYAFTSPNVLRWRSRLPSDPPFANEEITYVIAYALVGVLRGSGGSYVLNHDFAFTDRPGLIEHFSLRLDLDPVWHGATSPILLERDRLAVGQGVVVPLKLQFAGTGPAPAANTRVETPADVRELVSDIYHNTEVPKSAYWLLTIFAIGLLAVVAAFIHAERATGRFAPLVAPDDIDEAWLNKNLFVISPEATAQAIESRLGPEEVAAMLARMTQEKKIATHLENRGLLVFQRPVLRMDLLVDRTSLSDSEGALVAALFGDSRVTDTGAIRERYKGAGFNPAAIVSDGVARELKKIPGWETRSPSNWKQAVALFVAAVALLVGAAMQGANDGRFVLIFGIANFVFGLFAAAAAARNAPAVADVAWRSLRAVLFLIPVFIVVVAIVLLAGRFELHLLTPIAMIVWAVVLTKVAFDRFRCPESPERIAFRKRLHAARRYFIRELRSREPRLRDAWYPYLLAFGLGKHVNRWFGTFGSQATSSDAFLSRDSPSTGSFAASSGFTGGGGDFGGAGASGGWGAAAAIIGAGVDAPSSSADGSGSSDGGGSSGSSGGGGGGGW